MVGVDIDGTHTATRDGPPVHPAAERGGNNLNGFEDVQTEKGFDGPWVSRPHTLDNDYYLELRSNPETRNPKPEKCSAILLDGGYHESRRCARDTYPESYTTKYSTIRRLFCFANGER